MLKPIFVCIYRNVCKTNGRTWMNDQNEDTSTEDEKDYKQIQKDLTELNPDGDEEGIESHAD
jgi:hypothetical protein